MVKSAKFAVHLFLFAFVAIAEANEKPNIIVILADDMGWADVGYHGSEIRTPNIDSLAESGTRLDQFYVQSTCSPTRAALLTGRYPVRIGMHRMVLRPWHVGGVPLTERLMSNALQGAGYWTAIVGKWHLGMSSKEYTPIERGFDWQYGHLGGSLDYFEHEYYGGLDWSRNLNSKADGGYTTDEITDECVQLIHDRPDDKPLFIYLAYNAPHAPLQAPETDIAAYGDTFDDPKRRTYAAMLSRMDEGIGRVVNALDEKGIREETLIFFCSDNGGIHSITADNGPLRGEKGQLYEGGVRVPALINWPGKVKAGEIVDEPMHIVDLYPTFLNLAGGAIAEDKMLDGLDVWATMTAGEPSPHDDILINVKKTTGPYLKGAIRSGQWKLVVNGAKDAKIGEQFELFDLSLDPSEMTNLADKNPEVVKDLHNRLKEYRQDEVRNPAFAPKPENWQGKSDWSKF